MNELSEIAAKWGANGQIELIAERENAVYKILRDGTPMALRLHRAGYQVKRQSCQNCAGRCGWRRRVLPAPNPSRRQMDPYWQSWPMDALSL